MPSKEKTISCKKCLGNGSVHISDTVVLTCTVCNGSGSVNIQLQTPNNNLSTNPVDQQYAMKGYICTRKV